MVEDKRGSHVAKSGECAGVAPGGCGRAIEPFTIPCLESPNSTLACCMQRSMARAGGYGRLAGAGKHASMERCKCAISM